LALRPSQIRRRTLLGSPLSLHDVEDVERLAARVLHERLREWRSTLPREKGEDALAFLISTAWELSLDHDPTKQAFSTRCYRTLRLRLVDWFRREFGDARHAPRPDLLSLDHELSTDDGDAVDGGDADRSRAAAWTDALTDDAANVEEAVFHSAAFGLEWADLSLAGFKALTEIGVPLSNGASLEAIARGLGESRRQVKRRLDELQAEILAKRPDLPEWLAA
jgi:hypothetical protein